MELLEYDLSMFPHTITMFTPYANINTNDESFKPYKDYYISTIIENVYYEESKNYNTVNSGATGLGDYTLTILLKQSRFYRYIDDIEVEVEYLENPYYINKGYDEQANKYFTITPNDCFFVLGTIEKYKNELKIPKKDIALNGSNLLKLSKQRHTVSGIDKDGLSVVLSITGRVQ